MSKIIFHGFVACLFVFSLMPIEADAAALKVGDAAPEIDAKDWLNGQGGTLAQAAAAKKVVVVEFWATWCGPCVQTIPHLNKLHNMYKDQGLIVIGLTNEPKAKIEKFVQTKKMAYLVGAGSETSNKYGVQGIPHAALVIDGKIAWMGHPASGLDKAIAAALSKK